MHGTFSFVLILLLALVACSPATSSPLGTPWPAVFGKPSPSAIPRPVSTVECIAQRGGAGLAAENTLNAFRISINFRPDFVEMDVHLTKDGVPIVMHDPTINRTTEGRGRIADMTLADLSRFSTHSTSQSYREPIPTLAQVLDLAKSKYVRVEVGIQLDADGRRYPEIEHKVVGELIARDMLDQARVLAFDLDTLRQVKTLRPETQTVALLSADYFRRIGNRDDVTVADDVSFLANGMGVDKTFLSANVIEAAHHRQMSVGVWTVDTEEEMDQFAKLGVDSITTNRPDICNRVFGR